MFLGFSETEINGIDVLKMAKCYMDAFYQKPPSIPRNDIVAMEETLNPHLAFSSGLEEWRQTKIHELKEEYSTNILKYAPLPNKETTLREWLKSMEFEEKKKILLKWQNYNHEKLEEAFLKEIDKKFKEWRDNVFYGSLGKTNELKGMLISKYTKIGKTHYDLLDKIKKEKEDDKKENLIKSLYVNLNIKEFKKWRKLTTKNIGKIQDIFIEDIDYKYDKWRTKLGPFSLPLRSAYLAVAKDLIQKLVNEISDEALKRILNGMLQRIKIEIQTNIPIIMYSFLSKYFDQDSFNKITKKLEAELEQVKVKAEFEDDYQNDIPKFPPVKRVICFDNINIQHIFASPYERTLQTALLLLGESHKNFDSKGNLENELKIKVEPGFIENMIDCVNKPIGYEDINELAKHHSHLDSEYVPILNREDLAREYKEEESLESDIGCFNRVEYVLNQLLYNDKKQCLKNPFFNKSLVDQIGKGNYHSEWIQPGEESAVKHGMLLNAVHNHIAGIEYAKGQQGTTSSSNENDYFKNLRLVYFGAVTPLIEAGEKLEDLFNH
uniref:Uncharacterized protein n=1 Tax=Meloidogyne floridensis TaxID=298350 RepID=A0A915PH62_9BILA